MEEFETEEEEPWYDQQDLEQGRVARAMQCVELCTAFTEKKPTRPDLRSQIINTLMNSQRQMPYCIAKRMNIVFVIE